jgi:hypothetical protein
LILQHGCYADPSTAPRRGGTLTRVPSSGTPSHPCWVYILFRCTFDAWRQPYLVLCLCLYSQTKRFDESIHTNHQNYTAHYQSTSRINPHQNITITRMISTPPFFHSLPDFELTLLFQMGQVLEISFQTSSFATHSRPQTQLPLISAFDRCSSCIACERE